MMDAPFATARALPSLPRIGDVVGGRFSILASLGEGGMGCVFEAHDRRLGRAVALKLLIPRYLGRAEREARIFREAELVRRVGAHPNLVKVIETGRLGADEWPFLVMELVEGKDLASQIAFEGAMPPLRAAKVARQIARAVQALHRKGVVHRDVTPMNVLMQGDDAVLIDLSHAGDEDASPASKRLTGPHEVPGTHHYMSREQASAAPAHPAMDVYAFGVTLVQMLTGVAPRGYDRETFIAKQKLGLVEAPRVDVRVHPSVPEVLAELANACTRPEAELRPAMDEVVARLCAALRAMDPEVGDGVRAPRVLEPGGSAPAPTPKAGRTWWLVAGLAVVSIVVLAGVVWASFRRPPPEQADAATPSKDSERAPAPEPEPEPASEPRPPERPPPERPPEVEAADSGESEDGAAVQPVVGEPEPAPEPKRGRGTRSKPTMPSAKACVQIREATAEAQRSYDWTVVLEHTERRACWSRSERKRLRVLAQLELGRFEACAREGRGSSDPKIVILVQKCEGAIR